MNWNDVMNKPKQRAVKALALLFSTIASVYPALAEEQPQEMRLQSDVQGQSSQPKVLFILPWEDQLKTESIDLDESLISEEDFLSPIDRAVFQEQVNMYRQLETNK